MRPLGIPTINDRIAQMAVKLMIEPRLEKIFHRCSHGYRPGRSALDAVRAARQNNWRYDWVLDVDIKGFFDELDHELLMRAVSKHVTEGWIRLYIRRWLQSPVQEGSGQLRERNRGTPQGGVISPLLANLYLHYAFDVWVSRNHSDIVFERYADDIVCHGKSEGRVRALLDAMRDRFATCGLTLHPKKTRVVYCKDSRRKMAYPCVRYDFLGFSFHARTAQDRQGNLFAGFQPAVSRDALKRMGKEIRDMGIKMRTQATLSELAEMVNPKVRGWIAYFGNLYPQPLKRFLARIDLKLGAWARKKYKHLRAHRRRSWNWLKQWRERQPELFAHWLFVYGPGKG